MPLARVVKSSVLWHIYVAPEVPADTIAPVPRLFPGQPLKSTALPSVSGAVGLPPASLRRSG